MTKGTTEEWTRRPTMEDYEHYILGKYDKERLRREVSIASSEGCDNLEMFLREICPELFD